MKLLIILPTNYRGGAEEYTLKIARSAKEKQWDIVAAVNYTSQTKSLIKDFENLGIKCYPLEYTEVGKNKLALVSKNLRKIVSLFKLLTTVKTDVILLNLPAHHFAFTTLCLCGLFKIPTAVVFHLIPFQANFNQVKLAAYHWAKSRRQKWIAIADYNRQILAQEFNLAPQNWERIYNGIDLEKLALKNCDPKATQERNRAREQIRQELGLSPDTKILLTVARLHGQKGHDYLIPAIPQIVARFPDIHFVWVGDGELQDRLENLLKQYGVREKVTFLGHRLDIPRLLTAADLFVFPSYQEGLPFAIMEAMALGLPIVTSDTGGIPELITDGEQGLIFPTGDTSALLAKLNYALANPQKMLQMGELAKLRVANFSVARMNEKTLKILQDLNS